MNEKRDTVGQISVDLSHKQPDSSSPIEIGSELLTDWDKNIFECIHKYRQEYASDFYIVVITKREPLMPNVFRNYFFGRKSCPTPDYDQTVYTYDYSVDEIQFLWVIPSRDACHYLKDNALQVAPQERQLLNFVLQFSDGSLYLLAKKLNKEHIDSPVLEK